MYSKDQEKKFCSKGKRMIAVHARDLLIVIVMGNLLFYLMLPEKITALKIFQYSLFSLLIGGGTWKGIEFISTFLHNKLDVYKNPYRALRWSLGVSLLYAVIYILITNYLVYVLIMRGPIHFFSLDMLRILLVQLGITLIITLIYYSYGFFHAWKEAALNEERLKKEQIALQFIALKNQVNPHFLFNSLNTLSGLIYKDPGMADVFIRKLSEVYRYVLEQNDREVVPFETEMKFIDSYISLLRTRFGDSLQIEISNQSPEGMMIIPMAIQIALENAIKHNIVSSEEPLRIRIVSDQESVTIANNLQKKENVARGSGIGLENMRKRYSFLTASIVSVVQTEKEFIVKLPLIKQMQP